MTNVRPFSREMLIQHLNQMYFETDNELDKAMLEAAVQDLIPKKCFECGEELLYFCARCNDPLAGYERITDEHKKGQLLQLTSEARRWSQPAEVGFWNDKCSRWEVHREGERPILYGPWVFTHARPVP